MSWIQYIWGGLEGMKGGGVDGELNTVISYIGTGKQLLYAH